MRLGVLVAMPSEAGTLTRRPLSVGERVSLQPETFLSVSGIGSRRARLAAEECIRQGAEALLSWGTAGSLSSDILPGDLILPRKVLSADRTLYETDADWHSRIRQRLGGRVRYHEVLLAETPKVLVTPSEKKDLRDRTEALAADMESATIASVAKGAGVPFLAVRVVTDSADRPLPRSSLAAFDPTGRFMPTKALSVVLRHPNEMADLIRLGLNFRKALRTLRKVHHLIGYNFCVEGEKDKPDL